MPNLDILYVKLAIELHIKTQHKQHAIYRLQTQDWSFCLQGGSTLTPLTRGPTLAGCLLLFTHNRHRQKPCFRITFFYKEYLVLRRQKKFHPNASHQQLTVLSSTKSTLNYRPKNKKIFKKLRLAVIHKIDYHRRIMQSTPKHTWIMLSTPTQRAIDTKNLSGIG